MTTSTSSALIQPLDGGGAGVDLLGGKGASLARLTAAGLPVPPGFVLTTTAYAAAPDRTLTDEVSRALLDAYRALGAPAVAVRSSATAEDAADTSFAGQLESVLDVRGDEALLDAVRRCWASADSARVAAYRDRVGVGADDLAVAVVAQEMVDADAAGVVFTADPVTGDDATIVVNSVLGPGASLVDGTADPETHLIDKVTGTISTGGRSRTLTVDQATRLGRLATTIETEYGGPVDVEWCRRGDELFIVQARPITTHTGPDPWNDSLTGDFLWTNTNVGEAIPDVMTPATWSMVQVFLTDAMATASIPPYVGYGRIGGRIYLNVSVMATLSRAVGVSDHRFRRLTEEVFGRLPADLEIPPVPAHALRVLRGVLPMGLHVLHEARRDMKVLDAYLDDHPRRCEERRAQIAAVTSGPDLALLWTEVVDPEFNRVSWMLSAATRSSGATFVTTRQRLQRLVGSAAANALTAGLGSSAGQLASLGLLDGLELVASGQLDRDTFGTRYGHRGPHEFEISTPRPGEDPAWVEGQLRSRAELTTNHREMITRQEVARAEAWVDLRRRRRWQARVLGRQLDRWAKISRDREQARSEVIRYFWVLRAYALRAGELTGLGDGIFFLEAHEIVRVLNGETLNPDTIAERRAAYEAYRALPSYPALIRGRFHPYAWAADPRRRGDLFVAGDRSAVDARVCGFPGSAGVVEGRVRVLLDADHAVLDVGEILVTTVTNVGWTPLFPRAAAVVTDVGAPLSHAAIVARELGIPAVVGCGNATTVLRTGDRVRVDGTAGTVEVLT